MVRKSGFLRPKSRFLCPKSGFLVPEVSELCPRKWLFEDHLSIFSPTFAGLTTNTEQLALLLMNIEFRGAGESLARIVLQAHTYVATFFPLLISLNRSVSAIR
jgi:hypothetical protein